MKFLLVEKKMVKFVHHHKRFNQHNRHHEGHIVKRCKCRVSVKTKKVTVTIVETSNEKLTSQQMKVVLKNFYHHICQFREALMEDCLRMRKLDDDFADKLAEQLAEASESKEEMTMARCDVFAFKVYDLCHEISMMYNLTHFPEARHAYELLVDDLHVYESAKYEGLGIIGYPYLSKEDGIYSQSNGFVIIH